MIFMGPSSFAEVIAEPSMRSHPTVGRLCSELGAAVVTDMDQARLGRWRCWMEPTGKPP